MKNFILYFKFICIYSLVFLLNSSAKGQIANVNSSTNNVNSQIETYSKADWNGKGMFSAYKPIDEIVDSRTRTSKHFLNPDGTKSAILTSGYSINYKENGIWKTINREIVSNNTSKNTKYPYANTSNVFKSFYPATGGNDGIVTSLIEGDVYEWINPNMYYLVNGEKVNYKAYNIATVQINENEITYTNLFNNIDVKFIQGNDGRKMDIILNNSQAISNAPANANFLVFEETVKIPSGWTTKESEGAINLYNEKNEWIIKYSKPLYYDSNINKSVKKAENDNNTLANVIDDSKIFGNYSITKDGQNIIISMLVPINWLKDNNRKYPVVIDPTAVIYPNNSSNYTGYVTRTPFSTYSKTSDPIYHLSTSLPSTGNENRGYMKFDLSSLSLSTSISFATLNYYCYDNQGTSYAVNNIYPLINDPVTANAVALFNDCGNGLIADTSTWLHSIMSWYNDSLFPTELINIQSRIASPGWVGYGIVRGGTNWYDFYGYSDASYKPYLYVNYSCVTVSVPTYLASNINNYCSNTTGNLTLTASGGSGTTLNWYTDGCGVTPLATGNVLSFTLPTITNSYWVRRENLCAEYSNCLSKTIIVYEYPTSPTLVSVDRNAYCANAGGDITLSCTGGDGLTMGWYIVGCGFAKLGTGTPFAWPAPTITTSYWVRNESPSCSNSTCLSIEIIVYPLTSPPLSASVDRNNLCSNDGGNIILSISGGMGTTVKWYEAGCEISQVGAGNGDTIPVPTVTTTYWVNWTSPSCTNSTCISITETIIPAPVAPLSASTDRNGFCDNDAGNITLTVSGGSGDDAYWYSGSCGGTNIGIGINLTIASPTTTTTYWVNWQGAGCTNSTCASINVDVLPAPNPISAITGSVNVCQGATEIYSVVLESGTTYAWTKPGGWTGTSTTNSITCTVGGASGNIKVTPTNSCGAGTPASIYVLVNTTSTNPTSASSPSSVVCQGVSVVLNKTGGTLGTGAYWYWYSGSCGGTFVASSAATFIVTTPTITTKYYVRGENACNTTLCVTVNITVNTSSTPPDSTISTPTLICSGDSSSIQLYGGILGTGSYWYWYAGGCGGTPIASGTSTTLIQSPTVSTDYYIRAEGNCNTTSCVYALIDVSDSSYQATSITASSNVICFTDEDTLNVSGGTLALFADWYWYSGTCGGTFEGNGSQLLITPLVSDIYYVRAEGVCNTTLCVSISITVNLPSLDPTIATGNSPICSGMQSSTLGVSDGSLGTGANWNWYNSSCGLSYVISGIAPVVNPTITTIYWARAEGICNITTCASVTVVVNSISIIPDSALSISPICPTQQTTLSLYGGTLGDGAKWIWYSGSCGGAIVASGVAPVLSPTVTTLYYVRAEGLCNQTLCVSTTVVLKVASTQATSASALPLAVCSGNPSTLTLSGGSLGTNGIWKWYSNSCGGGSVLGTGTTLVQSPTATTLYYVRAEGDCITTNCVSVTITLNTSSTDPTSATALPTGVCLGNSSLLTLNDGSLGTGANWMWYAGSCGGGSSVGAGITTTQTPAVLTIYYVRAEGTCNTTLCASVTVTINTQSTQATSASALPTSVCSGDSSVLTLSGGTLGTGANWYWYVSACGTGSSVGAGITTTQSPTVTTLYYVRAEGTCNTTLCVSVTVTLNTSSANPTSATSLPTGVCTGNSSLLTLNDGSLGTGANWYWYAGGCGTGSSIETGLTSTQTPTATTIYYVRAEGTCNTTSCASVTVILYTQSVLATSVLATPTSVCIGDSTTLTLTGGTLGTNAFWKWYSGSCGGATIGTGAPLVVYPTVITEYFLRAEGQCNQTLCLSLTVTINDQSLPATSATSSPISICTGDPTTLTLTGGSLGTNAAWYWYNGACGGSPIGTGTSIEQIPTATTTYFVRAEGDCNSTICVTANITLNTLSTDPTSASALPTGVCSGLSSTLSVNGGSLGTNAAWYWYNGSCGGISIGTGVTFEQSPIAITLYYVRAIGTCNTTLCASVTVILNTASTDPSSATANPTTLCGSGSTTLTVNGGSLGTNAAWNWYDGACGGTAIGTGVTFEQTPTVTIIYYVRAEGDCNSTNCVSVTVTFNTLSTNPTSATANPTGVCSGFSTTLSVNGGSLGTNAAWYWFDGSCGGTPLGTGATLEQSPTVTTTYYVKAMGTCDTTLCAVTTVTYLTLPSQPDSIVGNIYPMPGSVDIYTITNVAGVNYSWTIPSFGWSGTSTSNTITLTADTGSGVISVTPSNACGNGPVRTLFVSNGYTIDGYFNYDNNALTPLDSVIVYLMRNGSTIASTQADINGYYQFNYVHNDTYNITATTNKLWNSAVVNVTDAVKIKRHYAGSELFTSSLRLHAGDVNASMLINVSDGVKVVKRFSGADTAFIDTYTSLIRYDWIFEKPFGGDVIDVSSQILYTTVYNDTVIVNGNNVNQDFRGLILGDVNGSYIPPTGAKSSPKISLNNENIIRLNSNEYFELPIKIAENVDFSAVSLILNYPEKLVDIEDIQMVIGNEYKDLIYHIKGNEIRIGWYIENEDVLKLNKDDVFMVIKLKTKNNFKPGDAIRFTVADNYLVEFADEEGNPIDNVNIKISTIEYKNCSNSINSTSISDNNIRLYPNPAKDILNINYNISIDGNVKIELYNVLGEKIITVVNAKKIQGSHLTNVDISNITSGVYTCKMVYNNETVVKRFVISR